MINIRPKNGSEQGSGMIDIIIAVVLLGIAFVGMLAGFTHASVGTRENRERIQATMLMQETMETVKQYDGKTAINLAQTIPFGATRVGTPISTNAVYKITPNNVEYTVTATAAPANGLGLQNLQAVTVTVAWRENDKNRQLQMLEYIYLVN